MQLSVLLILNDYAVGETELFLIPAHEKAATAAMALSGQEYEFPEDNAEYDANAEILFKWLSNSENRDTYHQGAVTDGPFNLPREPVHVASISFLNMPEFE